MTGPFGDFRTAISIDGVRAEVAVGGEVDMATAPTLGGLLGSLIDHGHTEIVLDLRGLGFLDASGIRVLFRVVELLRRHQGRLSVRSVPAHVQRILDITGFAALVEIAPAEVHDVVGAVEDALAGDLVAPGAMRRRFGAVPTSNDNVDAALRVVVSLASATVGGADGVSVSLYRHGRLMTAAASDETVLEMDHNQYDTGEGPCLSAAAEGHWFHVDTLADEQRWPEFIPRAVKEGIASILSSPLLTEGRPIGALNIYSRREHAFGPAEQELAALFATHASGILVDADEELSEEESSARIQEALLSRSVIAQAQGMLMERRQISADEAAAVIGRDSRTAGRTVLEQAVEMTRSKLGGGTKHRPTSAATANSGPTNEGGVTHG